MKNFTTLQKKKYEKNLAKCLYLKAILKTKMISFKNNKNIL